MKTYLVAFLSALLVSALLTPIVREISLRFRLFDDRVSSRKVHAGSVPRLGGIAIVVAFYTPLIGLLLYDNDVARAFRHTQLHAIGLFGGGLAIAALGAVDDIVGSRARYKLAVQLAVAMLMYACGFRIEVLANPFGSPIHIGVFSIPFTLLWITGVINAFNLIDGLDGLASGVALFAIGTTFAIAFGRGDVLMTLFMGALAGAVGGFLLYNFNPASIFMGDTGSMFLGFVLSTTALVTNQKSSTAVAMLIPIVALGLPIADTLLAMTRRLLRGRPIFSADGDHIHHRLLRLGLSQRQAVGVLYGVCLVLGCVALALSYASSRETSILLSGVFIAALVFGAKTGILSFSGAYRMLKEGHGRSRNREVRRWVRAAGERLRYASTHDDIWEAVRGIGSELSASEVALSVYMAVDTPQGRSMTRVWGDRSHVGTSFSMRMPVEGRGRRYGVVEIVWKDGRTRVLRDDEIAVELLCHDIAHALERLGIAAAAPGAEVALLRRD